MVMSIEKDEQIKSYLENEKQIPEFPPLPSISTDVSLVPEHEKFEFENTISNLEGEIKEMRLRQKYLDKRRREALNKILDIKGFIRVFCCIRPLLSAKKNIYQTIVADSEKIVVGSAGNKKEFGCDKVFTQETTREDIFVEVKPILRSALDGHNVCVLAYGQTGTGKTYTMDGTNESPGIVLRALEELFRQSSLDTSASFSFSISMLEVYLGNIRDLLAPKSSSRTIGPISKCNLNIQTDPNGIIEIEGLSQVEVSNFLKASWWYTKGRRARATSSTSVNDASSRSHCLTRINIFRQGDAIGKVEVSKLWMVDLGGSERLLKTGATGQTLDEGRAINLSLSALGDVIAALRRKRGHVPYRNSKLTQILKDSLGYGSKVVMLVHVSQYEEDIAETTCSLTFAQRARAVESTRELPEDLKRHKENKIAELEVEIREAEVEHKAITNQIQTAESLLCEKRQLFSTKYELVEDDGQTPASGKQELGEIPKTPVIISEKKGKKKESSSLPRFMNATMASRQRQSVAEREIEAKAKMLRSWAQNSAHVSSFQSHSLLDPHFKALLKKSNKNSANGEKTTPLIESTRFNVSSPRAQAVRSSDPNVKVNALGHRRRMSNMI